MDQDGPTNSYPESGDVFKEQVLTMLGDLSSTMQSVAKRMTDLEQNETRSVSNSTPRVIHSEALELELETTPEQNTRAQSALANPQGPEVVNSSP